MGGKWEDKAAVVSVAAESGSFFFPRCASEQTRRA